MKKNVNEYDIGVDFRFLDQECVDTLNEDIWNCLDDNYSIHDDYSCHIFDLDREGFINIVKIIP